MRRLLLLGLVAFLFASLACAGDDDADSDVPPIPTVTATSQPGTSTPGSEPTPTSAPTTPPSARQPAIALQPAFGGRAFERPTELVPYPGGTFLLADQSGLVLHINAEGETLGTFLDQRAVTLRGGNEEGLLSLTLDPAFESNRLVYVYASRGDPRRTVLLRYRVASGDAIDPASELVILQVPQPFSNHNGGSVRFGPDGLLYLSLGDGGSRGDPDGNGQDLRVVLGKILRLDVRSASAAQPYRASGDPGLASRGGRPEVYAYGLRNPWRMEFDPATGDLYAGDVGQNRFEEVDRIVGGGNYGWNTLEGFECFQPSSGCDTTGLVPPLAAYDRSGGSCSVTGGHVYRGTEIADLDGFYLYADFCSGFLWGWPTDAEAGSGAERLFGSTRLRISSFARGHDGELYVLAFGSPIMRIAGGS
jgi:glucose/arabinose dehydrogenase